MENGKIIIGLVGEQAAGKGTVADYLVKKYGAATHRFSTSMQDCLRRLHLPVSRDNLVAFSVITRQAYGDDLYAKVIASDCDADGSALTVVDGIRLPDDISILKGKPGFHLVYVTAPAELRYERSKKRGEKDGEKDATFAQFMETETAPTEVAIRQIGESAEFIVDNSGTVDELYASIGSIIDYVRAGDFDHPHPHRNKLHPKP